MAPLVQVGTSRNSRHSLRIALIPPAKQGLIYLLVLTMKHMDLMSTLQDVRTTMDRITFQKN